MSRKQTIIRGTIILTITGFLSRFMGFFYRIFLSRTFGEEGVGLYQLIFPVYALCYSLTTAGIETAISRTVARKISLGREREAREFLLTGLSLSFFLACICMVAMQKNAGFIASEILGDERCVPLLTILSYTVPCSAVHSCICGYCYGLKQTSIPAAAQLIEQSTRIAGVYLLYRVLIRNQGNAPVTIAVCGLVIGEFFSALYTTTILPGFLKGRSITQVLRRRASSGFPAGRAFPSMTAGILCRRLKELLPLSVPLTANRVLINLLQSIEAISIPGRLQRFGLDTSQALSLYGVLNGMALPCILFPSAVTSSISIMLMPTVAEIQASDDRSEMLDIIKKVTGACFTLGLFCCLTFLLFGSWIGLALFGSRTAGKFILTLAWICPFLYTNSALSSIINGLGKTGSTLFVNTFSLLIRIFGVFYAIPLFGIQGYLWGLLISQLAATLLSVWIIYQNTGRKAAL
ncbi:MAG: polysaccharide biosynthesis protein [Ruminococcus sp.]|nr:polysaccharide biosynthesis protein [Ruminococcus sp.]